MFGLLFWVSIGDMGITMNFGANLGIGGSLQRVQELRAELSRAELSKAELKTSFHFTLETSSHLERRDFAEELQGFFKFQGLCLPLF